MSLRRPALPTSPGRPRAPARRLAPRVVAAASSFAGAAPPPWGAPAFEPPARATSSSPPPASWDPLALFAATARDPTGTPPPARAGRGGSAAPGGDDGPGAPRAVKLATMLALVVFSRVGVYERIPGVDVAAFAASLQSGGLLGYIDTLSGGSISRVGVFSLGIVPYINASIVLQLLATAFPSLKKLQREEGPQGQARFQLYQKLLALAFAGVQAGGQLAYVRPYVEDWSPGWAAGAALTLVAGAMVLVHVADTISELKVGNGTSVLITANIASSLPASVGAAVGQAADADKTSLGLYALSFLVTTLGVVYVQEAERKIPMNYASRYRNSALARQSYLPFKVGDEAGASHSFSLSVPSTPASSSPPPPLPPRRSTPPA